MPLTDAKLRTLKKRASPFKVSDAEGLYVLVAPSGSKMWRCRAGTLVGRLIFPEAHLDQQIQSKQVRDAARMKQFIPRQRRGLPPRTLRRVREYIDANFAKASGAQAHIPSTSQRVIHRFVDRRICGADFQMLTQAETVHRASIIFGFGAICLFFAALRFWSGKAFLGFGWR